MSYRLEFVTKGSGFKVNEVAGEALGDKKLVYRNAAGTWGLADADAVSTMPVLGITMGAIQNGRKGEILQQGIIGDNTWTWTPGDEIYASTTAGELTQTAPAGAGDVIQVIAIAVTATLIQFWGNVGGAQGGANAIEQADYVFGTDGTNHWAINASTGILQFGGVSNEGGINGLDAGLVLQAAHDALPTGGGMVLAREGDFTYLTRVTVTKPLTLGGQGTGKTTFILGDGVDNNIMRVQSTTTNFYTYGISWDGNKANQNVSNVTILAVRSDFSTVIDCEFFDSVNSGFAFDAVQFCFSIRNYCHDNDSEGCGVVSLTGESEDVWYIDNICENNGTEGIIVSDAGTNGVTKIHLRGNRLIGNTNKGIQISNGADEITVIDNYATGNDIGINASGSTGLRDMTDIKIIGNHCEGNLGVTGIGLSRVEKFIIADNDIKTHAAANARSIYILGCTKGEVHDNICEDHAGAGIQVTDSGAFTSTYVDVHNNNIDGGTYGLFEGGSSDNNRFKDNTILNASTAPASIAGADTIVEEFYIYVKDPDTLLGTSHPSLILPDTVDTTIYEQIPIPLEFQHLITSQAVVVPGGTGNIRYLCSAEWGKLCAGEDYDAGSDTLGATELAVTQNKLSCLSITGTLSGIAAGDLIGLAFTRQASNVGDTVNADCYYLGVRIRYV